MALRFFRSVPAREPRPGDRAALARSASRRSACSPARDEPAGGRARQEGQGCGCFRRVRAAHPRACRDDRPLQEPSELVDVRVRATQTAH